MTAAIELGRVRDQRRTSDVLRTFLHIYDGERVSLGNLMTVLGDRAYGVLMLVFAFPNVIPTGLPGISSILGVPLILLATQLTLGHRRPWLPRWLSARSLARADFEKGVLKLLPQLERAERLLRPRVSPLMNWTGERILGAVCLGLAVILALPIPFGNMLPGLAICIFALALIEKDGLAYLFGLATTVASLAVVSVVIIAMIKALFFFLAHALEW